MRRPFTQPFHEGVLMLWRAHACCGAYLCLRPDRAAHGLCLSAYPTPRQGMLAHTVLVSEARKLPQGGLYPRAIDRILNTIQVCVCGGGGAGEWRNVYVVQVGAKATHGLTNYHSFHDAQRVHAAC